MKVFRVDSSGARLAVPEVSPSEKRFSFFHGGPEGEYCFRLSRNRFPVGGVCHDWEEQEYSLVEASPPQRDGLGNVVYALRRGVLVSGCNDCIVFVDMVWSPGNHVQFANFYSENGDVEVLGRGVGFPSRRKNGSVRYAPAVEYPVLRCTVGARFSWEQTGQFGKHSFVAHWNGVTWMVAPQAPFLPHHAEKHLAVRGWVRL